jgi:hypothetical protein
MHTITAMKQNFFSGKPAWRELFSGIVLTGLGLSFAAAETAERPTSPGTLPTPARVAQHAASSEPAAAAQSPWQFHPEAAQKLLEHGIERLVFVRRYTLSADHVYTEHVNSRWMPDSALCVLELRTGEVREIAADFTRSGVVNRFDLSFDARRILFDFKPSNGEGYRLHEVHLEGGVPRQITFPAANEAELVARFQLGGYHHGTDDMHPCYLPDGGIAFVTTRSQYGVLCDAGDRFTVSNLYRVNGDGSDMRPLSVSALNEQSPTLLPDGRILYHRWEYLDKPAGNIKGLWAMHPDGSGSVEIYGNEIAFPETMIYGRAIPGAGKIVFLGASHCCPNNAMGTVITFDLGSDTRSPDSMRFVTPDIHALHHNGFHFRGEDGKWIHDMTGTLGRLFKDPFPVSEELFIVSHKPAGLPWNEPAGYGLSLLDTDGKTMPLLRHESISLWHAYPLMPRPVPPVIQGRRDPALAAAEQAAVLVTDVYEGLEGVSRGSVRFIRILEQLGRPWAARKSWNDRLGHAHSVVGDGSLSVKVQHGIVPVEEDGSAHFIVPAMRNIYFQALDENYMALQTQRTFVNYMPGETRSCVGCHAQSNRAAPPEPRFSLAALRAPSRPQAQPGEQAAVKLFDYERHIQPIWDRHCIRCHNDARAEGGLNLAGTPTTTFSTSYDQLIKLSRTSHQLLGFRKARNEDAAWLGQDEVQHLTAFTLGSPGSTLGAWLSEGRVQMRDEKLQGYVDHLKKTHPDTLIAREEFIQLVNWLDVNAPFHASYWGRLNSRYQGHPNFRPAITVEEALLREMPETVRQAEAAGAQFQPVSEKPSAAPGTN